MKKTIFALSIAFVALGLTSCEKETKLSEGDFPSEIKDYVSTHFSESAILQVVKDRDNFELGYDVSLENSVFLEFNKKKEIEEIEAAGELPASVIPTPIADYVAAEYSENFITGWELDDKNQQVTLDSGLELEFDMEGNFLRIED